MWKEDWIFRTEGSSNYRIPSLVVSKDGTVHAFCNDRRETVADDAEESVIVYARKKPGHDWEPVRELDHIPGWGILIGAAVYDEITDTVFCSILRVPKMKNEFRSYTQEMKDEYARREQEKGIKGGRYLLYSIDGGDTWKERPLELEKTPAVHWDGTTEMIGGSCHGSAHGIQLKHGKYKGRLLCPSQISMGNKYLYDEDGTRRCCYYNNSIYSDDHGLTWKAGKPVQLGTGEGTLIENRDGTITYNSRAFFKNCNRYLATSCDGGATYGNFRADEFLIEDEAIGCNASFLRVEREDIRNTVLLPEDAEAVTLFVNPRSRTRDHMTVCLSYDGGETWAKTKLIREGCCAYSSLDFSKEEQVFYLLYELGEKNPYDKGLTVAAFDLDWLLA